TSWRGRSSAVAAGTGGARPKASTRSSSASRTRPRRMTKAQRADAGDAVGLGDREAASYRREIGAADRARDEAEARGRREGTAQARARRGRRLDVDAVRTGTHDDIAESAAREAFSAERRKQRQGDVAGVAAPITRRLPSGHQAAGFLLGLFAYALTINYLRGGSTQVKQWLAAKFLNQIPSDVNAPPPSSATPATPSPPKGGVTIP